MIILKIKLLELSLHLLRSNELIMFFPSGPGEQGSAVILSAEEEKMKSDLYKVNGFNAFASDKISLDRAIKDIRHPE